MKKIYFLYVFILLLSVNCKKDYVPTAVTAANNYLVVDGYIDADANSITTFKFSRSRNLVDTVLFIPELNAQVSVEAKSGTIYNLNAIGNGTYKTNNISISQTGQYRINIKTSDGQQYSSDFVPVRITPPIDSITWVQNSNVNLFVNSHDPANATKYYRWDYDETWEYHSPLEGDAGIVNGFLIFTDSITQTHKCWIDSLSTHILVGTSVALSSDYISHQLIQTIIKDNERITVRYSMLLNQYAITVDAYNYWLIIQKNSEQLGTLFDLQPSQLIGNIHCTTNINEPVIGFVGASTTQQKRIFIQNSEVNNWTTDIPHSQCDTTFLPVSFNIYPIPFTNPDPKFYPFYFSGSNLVLTNRECVDCRTRGGATTIPSFW